MNIKIENIDGVWCEIDTPQDLEIAKRIFKWYNKNIQISLRINLFNKNQKYDFREKLFLIF